MKNRITALVIALTLILGAIPAISVMAEESSAPEIISQNIEYGGYFGLMYAVDAATVKGGKVTVTVYDAQMNEVGSYTQTKTEEITTANGNKVTVYALTTAPVAAKDMADTYYAKATDGEGNESALKRYSVGEYLYERLYANGFINAEEGTKEYNKKEFYENTLAMGASAQTVLVNDKKAENEAAETLVTDYKYISVSGGAFADGYTAGIFKAGEEVQLTLTAKAPEKTEFAGWLSNGAVYSETNSVTVTDHALLTPNFESTVLTFDDGVISSKITSNLVNGTLTIGKRYDQTALAFTTIKDSNDSIKFHPTQAAEEGYNKVIFEADMSICHNGPSSSYNENFMLQDINGNLAYKFTIRHADAGAYMTDYNSAGGTTAGKVIGAKWSWIKVRIEYTYINENTVTINTYVNDVLQYESTNFYGAEAIKDVCVFRHVPDAGIGSTIYYDNVSFVQVKAD